MLEKQRRRLLPTTVAVWWFLISFIDDHGYSPSVREVAAGCFISSSAVARHVERLVEVGAVTQQPGKARSLRVVVLPPIADN